MVYVSQLLGKSIYYQDKPFGTIIDMAIFANRPQAPISKFEIKRGKKKLTVSPQAIAYNGKQFILKTSQIPLLPYDHNDFYLAEDLLDKQVIDVDGKRLVRVNDIMLEGDNELHVAGIDIGFPGILRRLGVDFFQKYTSIIPWQYIEAFDYQTGNVQIKLAQHRLNALHPSEIADILEDAGAKERLGIVAALDAKKAARAIEETNDETQISILEELPVNRFKEVINKIQTPLLADILNHFHTQKTQEITKALGEEKAKRVQKLLSFPDDVAGGLMHPSFFSVDGAMTVKEVLKKLYTIEKSPEAIVVTNGNGKLVGTIRTKNLLILDYLALLKDIVEDKKFVFADRHASDIIKLFAEYNLRILPVVNKEKQPIGVVLIDDILDLLQGEQEHEAI